MATSNLGSLTNTPKILTDTVTSTEGDNTDIFQFNLGFTRNINIALTDITGTEQAALSLFKDSNGNGVLDSTDQVVSRTFDDGTSDAAINLRSQTAGTYFAKVTYGAGSPVDYKISLSAGTPGTASNLLPKEVEVGVLDSASYDNLINNSDTSDTYHFSLVNDNVAFSLSLNQLSADADVRLIKDFNSNGVFDVGEVIARSSNIGALPESINANLNAGDYFVQVYQYSGSTTYNLTMVALA
jgi:Bacterial pre-peptidase C-terminal domain